MGDGLGRVGGVDPIYPKWSDETERDRQERRGRDSRGRQWKEQEKDETHLREQFQEKAAPILPSTPERRFRAVETPAKAKESGRWAQERLSQLSIREKVGQFLFLVVDGAVDSDQLISLVEEFSVGGLFFSPPSGSLEAHLALIEQLQAVSETPLVIGAVFGGGSHFDETVRLPLPSTLGWIAELELLHDAGKMIGEYYRRLGFHAVMVPLVEATPSLSEQVGEDAFLSDDRGVALGRGIALMGGIEESGLLPVAQTCSESSEEAGEDWLLNQLLQPLSHLGYQQIRPFRQMAQAGVEPRLLPHMYYPVLVGERPGSQLHPDLALSFGHLLRSPGDWRERISVGREGVEEIAELLLAAVGDGAITRSEFDHRVLAILRAKEPFVEREGPTAKAADLNRESTDALHRKLYSYAISVRLNDPEALPLPDHFGVIEVDVEGESHFRQMLLARGEPLCITTSPFHLEDRAVEESIVEQMAQFKWVVVAVYKERSLSPHLFELLHRLRAHNKKVVLVAFLPFRSLKGVGRESAYLVANESEPAAQLAAADRLFQP